MARIKGVIAMIAVAALAALAAAGPAAKAHIDGGGVAITVLLAKPAEDTPDRAELWLIVENYTAAPAILRGLSSNKARRIVIERRRSLLGFEFGQTVDFLRIKPGERFFLAPPDYTVLAETDAPETLGSPDLRLEGDFGPLGVVEAHIELLPR